MTRVDFYVVADGAPDAGLSVAVRLAQKAFAAGHRLFIHTGSQQEASALNELLWRHTPASFLPHALADEDDQEAIVVGWQQEPANASDVLINTATDIPPFFSRFERVAEVVTQDPQRLEAMRAAWRFYRDRGYPLQKHDL